MRKDKEVYVPVFHEDPREDLQSLGYFRDIRVCFLSRRKGEENGKGGVKSDRRL